jgi:cyanophycinase
MFISADEATVAIHAIRRDGIDGAILLSGTGVTPVDAIVSFVNLAKQRESRIVVVLMSDGRSRTARMSDALAALLEQWSKVRGKSWQVFCTESAAEANSHDIVSALQDATGVWLDGGSVETWRALLASGAFHDGCRALLKRGGVLGAAVEASVAMSASACRDDSAALDSDRTRTPISEANWIPGLIVNSAASVDEQQTWRSEVLAKTPQCVGVQIGANTALLIRGRQLRQFGEGTVAIAFAPSASYPDKTIELSSRNRDEDLVALRRVAVQRLRPQFPETTPSKPVVDKGTLMIVGGGGTPRGLMSRFVAAAGGSEAIIAVIPISMPEPLPARDGTAELFRREGAKEVHVLRGRTPREVDQPETLEILRRTTGIWFGGGRQWRFIDAYEGTQAADLMHDVLRRGGVIAGSSAGASIQGEYMARGNPLGPMNIMAHGYERGLAFLKGVAIDQHFTQRKRLPDMSSLVDRYPQLLGIGIDEGTAIIVNGSIANVVGRGRVSFYDRNKPVISGKADHEFVLDGGRYDLVERRVLDPGKAPTTSDRPSML